MEKNITESNGNNYMKKAVISNSQIHEKILR